MNETITKCRDFGNNDNDDDDDANNNTFIVTLYERKWEKP